MTINQESSGVTRARPPLDTLAEKNTAATVRPIIYVRPKSQKVPSSGRSGTDLFERTVYLYYTSCKFDEADYTNRPPVSACAAGQQCFVTIKNFDPNGSILQDVKNDEIGNTHVVVAEFGCGDSGRFKNDWTEHHNRFEEKGVQDRNQYFGQEGICYGDDTDGTVVMR